MENRNAGLEALATAKDIAPHMGRILMSGGSPDKEKVKDLCHGFIEKPSDIGNIVTLIQTLQGQIQQSLL